MQSQSQPQSSASAFSASSSYQFNFNSNPTTATHRSAEGMLMNVNIGHQHHQQHSFHLVSPNSTSIPSASSIFNPQTSNQTSSFLLSDSSFSSSSSSSSLSRSRSHGGVLPHHSTISRLIDDEVGDEINTWGSQQQQQQSQQQQQQSQQQNRPQPVQTDLHSNKLLSQPSHPHSQSLGEENWQEQLISFSSSSHLRSTASSSSSSSSHAYDSQDPWLSSRSSSSSLRSTSSQLRSHQHDPASTDEWTNRASIEAMLEDDHHLITTTNSSNTSATNRRTLLPGSNEFVPESMSFVPDLIRTQSDRSELRSIARSSSQQSHPPPSHLASTVPQSTYSLQQRHQFLQQEIEEQTVGLGLRGIGGQLSSSDQLHLQRKQHSSSQQSQQQQYRDDLSYSLDPSARIFAPTATSSRSNHSNAHSHIPILRSVSNPTDLAALAVEGGGSSRMGSNGSLNGFPSSLNSFTSSFAEEDELLSHHTNNKINLLPSTTPASITSHHIPITSVRSGYESKTMFGLLELDPLTRSTTAPIVSSQLKYPSAGGPPHLTAHESDVVAAFGGIPPRQVTYQAPTQANQTQSNQVHGHHRHGKSTSGGGNTTHTTNMSSSGKGLTRSVSNSTSLLEDRDEKHENMIGEGDERDRSRDQINYHQSQHHSHSQRDQLPSQSQRIHRQQQFYQSSNVRRSRDPSSASSFDDDFDVPPSNQNTNVETFYTSSPGHEFRRLAEQFLDSVGDESPAMSSRRLAFGKGEGHQGVQTNGQIGSHHSLHQQQQQQQQQQQHHPSHPHLHGIPPQSHSSHLHPMLPQQHQAHQQQQGTLLHNHNLPSRTNNNNHKHQNNSRGGRNNNNNNRNNNNNATNNTSSSHPQPSSDDSSNPAASASPLSAHESLLEKQRQAMDNYESMIAQQQELLAMKLTQQAANMTDKDEAALMNQLKEEIREFSNQCAKLQDDQFLLRQELANRTRWAVRSVWPTAEVDLVGSVSARVALPKSDLDFVVYFPAIRETDTKPEFTFCTPATPSTAPPLQYNQDGTVNSCAPSVPLTAAQLPHYIQPFAHAGSLIKLIGGRKKSKLLFRSTKIQVFKDINLIRLRDGCSGISMDLWFPITPFISARSQAHTALIHSFIESYSSFFPLSCVIKSFMQQNLLNSGYSGLGSYGVLLMIVRYLQYERYERQTKQEKHKEKGEKQVERKERKEGEVEEKEEEKIADLTSSTSSTTSTSTDPETPVPNPDPALSDLLCGFFRFYCTFDYCNKAIRVNANGSFFDKPEIQLITKKMKNSSNPTPSTRGDGGDEDDDDGDDYHHGNDRRKGRHHKGEEDEEEDDDGVNGGGEGVEGVDKKLLASLNDQYTLVIQDPEDDTNYIICHHKALRNMIHAFIRALSILDPTSPLPPPPPPLILPGTTTTSAATTATPSITSPTNITAGPFAINAAPSPTNSNHLNVTVDSTSSVASSTVVSSLHSSPCTNGSRRSSLSSNHSPGDSPNTTASNTSMNSSVVSLDPVTVQPSAIAGTSVRSTSGISPAPSPAPSTTSSTNTIAPLTTLPLSSSTTTTLSRFHRLLDVVQAQQGPAMKPCPSPTCLSASPPTLCPIQNKVCFTCGYMFVNNNKTGNNTGNSSGGGVNSNVGQGNMNMNGNAGSMNMGMNGGGGIGMNGGNGGGIGTGNGIAGGGNKNMNGKNGGGNGNKNNKHAMNGRNNKNNNNNNGMGNSKQSNGGANLPLSSLGGNPLNVNMNGNLNAMNNLNLSNMNNGSYVNGVARNNNNNSGNNGNNNGSRSSHLPGNLGLSVVGPLIRSTSGGSSMNVGMGNNMNSNAGMIAPTLPLAAGGVGINGMNGVNLPAHPVPPQSHRSQSAHQPYNFQQQINSNSIHPHITGGAGGGGGGGAGTHHNKKQHHHHQQQQQLQQQHHSQDNHNHNGGNNNSSNNNNVNVSFVPVAYSMPVPVPVSVVYNFNNNNASGNGVSTNSANHHHNGVNGVTGQNNNNPSGSNQNLRQLHHISAQLNATNGGNNTNPNASLAHQHSLPNSSKFNQRGRSSMTYQQHQQHQQQQQQQSPSYLPHQSQLLSPSSINSRGGGAGGGMGGLNHGSVEFLSPTTNSVLPPAPHPMQQQSHPMMQPPLPHMRTHSQQTSSSNSNGIPHQYLNNNYQHQHQPSPHHHRY